MEPSIKINPSRILIIKLRKLGDIICSTPIVRQIKSLYPEAEITFLTEPLGTNVYRDSSYVDHLLVLNRKPSAGEYLKMCYKIFNMKFDLVLDLYFHNKTALITRLSGAKYRFGFSKSGGKTLAYNFTVQPSSEIKYSAKRQLKLIQALGGNYEDSDAAFEISEVAKNRGKQFAQKHNFTNKTIAFCVLSERSIAQVSTDLLVSIGNYLIGEGFDLYFVYGPNEKNKALKVYNKMENKEKCLIDYEIPTITEQRAIFEQCSMYVGNDGGNKHLATTASIPTIGLFYSDNPLIWTPEDRNRHNFLQTKNNENSFDEFKALFSSYSFEKETFLFERLQ